MRGMPFFIPTLYVRKTGKCHRGAWKAGWEIPNVIRPELKVRGMPFFFLTLHVGKTGEGLAGLSKVRRRSHQSAQKRSLLKRSPEWPKGTTVEEGQRQCSEEESRYWG